MYSDDYEEEEEVQEQSGNFFVNFYNNNKKLIWILGAIILFLIIASLLTRGGSRPNNNDDIKTEITIDQATLSLGKGQAKYLSAKVSTDNRPTITWESSDTNIVSVDSNTGLVRGVNLGSATITGTYIDTKEQKPYTVSCIVTVYDGDENIAVTSIEVPEGDLMLMVGSTETFPLSVNPTRGFINSREYKSSDESKVTVDDNGKIKGVAVGDAVVTVTINGTFTKELNVYVVDKNIVVGMKKNPTEINFNTQVLQVEIGKRQKLEYSTIPEDISNGLLEWSSSDESVVTVTKDGTITAIKEGTAYITVKALNDKSNQIMIEVVKGVVNVTSISADSTINMQAGETRVLTPTVLPNDASNKGLHFESDNLNVLSVANTYGGTFATLYAHAAGTATITITSIDGGNASTKVYVNVTGSQVIDNPGVNPGNNSGTTIIDDEPGNSGGSGSGRWYDGREYSVSSQDAKGNGTMWSTYSGVQGNGGSTGPVNATITIVSNATSTKSLKICTYNYGSTPCTESSGTKVTSSWKKTFSSIGTYVIRVWEYTSSGTLRRGPDDWYIWVKDTNATIIKDRCYVKDGVYWWDEDGSLYNQSGYTYKSAYTTEGACLANNGSKTISIAKPTSIVYCQTGLKYDGKQKELTKEPSSGFVFYNKYATTAGTYPVTARLLSGYKWSDGTTSDVTIYCSIAAASTSIKTPSITISPSSLTVSTKSGSCYFGTVQLTSNVDGKIEITRDDMSTGSSYAVGGNSISSGSKKSINICVMDSTNVNIKFTPNDTKNYNVVSKRIKVTVKK